MIPEPGSFIGTNESNLVVKLGVGNGVGITEEGTQRYLHLTFETADGAEALYLLADDYALALLDAVTDRVMVMLTGDPGVTAGPCGCAGCSGGMNCESEEVDRG